MNKPDDSHFMEQTLENLYALLAISNPRKSNKAQIHSNNNIFENLKGKKNKPLFEKVRKRKGGRNWQLV